MCYKLWHKHQMCHNLLFHAKTVFGYNHVAANLENGLVSRLHGNLPSISDITWQNVGNRWANLETRPFSRLAAVTIWPLTKYKVCQTPLICMNWMWYQFHKGGEPHVITYHAYAQCKQSYSGVWGHRCWHDQYSLVTSLWLPTTVLGAKTLLLYIIWKYRPLYSDPLP